MDINSKISLLNQNLGHFEFLKKIRFNTINSLIFEAFQLV